MKNFCDKAVKQIAVLIHNGFFHILLGGTLSKVIAFFSSIMIVRFVNKTDYAYLGYADNIYSYIYLITGFGLDSAILKFCVGKCRKKNKSYLTFALKYGLLAEVVIVGFVLCLVKIFPVAFEQARIYMYLMGLYPFFYFTATVLQAFMRAGLKYKEYAYAGILQTGAVLVVSLVLVFRIGAYSMIAARYISIVVVILFTYKVIKPEVADVSYGKISKEEAWKFIGFGISLLIANIFSMIMPVNESFLVNNLIRDTTASANFKVANLIPQQITFVTSSIAIYYFPLFAKMKHRKEIWEKSRQAGLLTLFVISGICIMGIIVSPVFIRIVYGNQYADITGIMILLWIAHSMNAGIRMLPMNILPAIGYTRFNLLMSVSACLVHFVIDYFSIKRWGISGAALAGILVYFLTGICYWIYLWNKTKIK